MNDWLPPILITIAVIITAVLTFIVAWGCRK